MPEPISSVEQQRTPLVGSGERSVEHDKWSGRRLGKYELIRQIGRGGMGVVFEAWDSLLKRKVAIKLKSKSVGEDAQDVERFLRESRALASLQHPNVVAAFEADVVDEQYLIVLELMSGGSLQELLQHGPLSCREATEAVTQACSGLEAAHRAGIIHRDIKPSNLLLSADGTVKLSDFGLARPHAPSGTTLTSSGSVLGTPQYMSPEQCRSERADERSDLYALGATYFALLTGVPPYGGPAPLLVMNAHLLDPVPDPRTLDARIPEGCSAIIQRAMAKDPDDRFSTASEMLAALQDLRSTLGPSSTSTDARLIGSRQIGRKSSAEQTIVERNGDAVSGGERQSQSRADESVPEGSMTDLSWGRGTQPQTQSPSIDGATEGPKAAESKKQRAAAGSFSGDRLVTIAIASFFGGLLLLYLYGEYLDRDAANFSRMHLASQHDAMPTVAVPIVSSDDDDNAELMPMDDPPQDVAAPQKRRLALPVVELPADAFRLPDMKINQAAKDDGRDVWECVVPGLAHVAVAHSGGFMVGLSRVDAPQAGLQSRVDVWSRSGESLLSTVLPGRPTSLAVSADSRRVAIGSETARGVAVFDSSNWERLPLTDLADDAVMTVALSDDARWLAHATSRASHAQWVLTDLSGEHATQRIAVEERGPIRSLGFASGAELMVATGGDGGMLRIWTGLPEHPESQSSRVWPAVQSLAFGPEHNLLAIRNGQTVSFWKPDGLIRRTQFGVPDAKTTCIAYSPRGEQVALAIGRWVRVVATDTQQSIANLRGFVEPVVSIAYLPDGSGLVVVTADGRLMISRGMTRSN